MVVERERGVGWDKKTGQHVIKNTAFPAKNPVKLQIATVVEPLNEKSCISLRSIA
jgi:hypothetical protein